MTLTANALATELKAMDLYDNEPEAISAWAAAFRAYMEDAQSNAIIINPLALLAAEAAMITGLAGLSTAGATAIQAGIVAFWGAIIPATAWLTVTLITPPVLLSGLVAALTSVFTANKDGSLSKDASMTAIASVIHTNNLGGTATWPTPILVQPIL